MPSKNWRTTDGCSYVYKEPPGTGWSPDIVHEHDDGTFWVFDETWGSELGPYSTWSEADDALNQYAKYEL